MSAAFTSCNIVLFPNTEVEQQAIEWSQKVSRHFKTKFVLDVHMFHPHITLYQSHYPTNKIEKIQEILTKVVKEFTPFEIEMQNFSIHYRTLFPTSKLKYKKPQES